MGKGSYLNYGTISSLNIDIPMSSHQRYGYSHETRVVLLNSNKLILTTEARLVFFWIVGIFFTKLYEEVSSRFESLVI